MFPRLLSLPEDATFFFWGPRQTGKTTLLRQAYPDAYWVDLLKADTFRRLTQAPERLREELAAMARPPFVVIDEIQKVPALLDEVHWLIENRDVRFALCGSSARKVRRGHANLLGGRALRCELFGLVAQEVGRDFRLGHMLNSGFLPRHYLAADPRRLLDAYVADYLREEVAAEGLVRNLPAFSEFLNVASLSDASIVNFSTIARDCGVSSHTIKSYFEILEDTLLGRWLPAYWPRPKRRVIQSPKFYFADVGVVNVLARRGRLEAGSPLYGAAFESWVHHELLAYNAYRERRAELSYWRLASGIEVDFVVNSAEVAIEAKASRHVHSEHLVGLRELKVDQPRVRARFVVCLEPRARVTDEGIVVLPALEFVRRLWAGDVF